MGKKFKFVLVGLLVLVCAVAIYVLTRPAIVFEDLNENSVEEVAYLTLHDGYQPLSPEESRNLIETLSGIKIKTVGSEAAAEKTGCVSTQFRITLTDGTQYIVADSYPHLVINGRGYVYAGEESRERLLELGRIFDRQPDHMVPW